MMRSTVFVVVVGLATALWSHAGFAEGAYAVWLLNGNPKQGYALGATADRATAADAQSGALAECRRQSALLKGAECKVIDTFRDACLQDAFNGDANTPSSAVGWAVGADRDTANRRSMEACERMRGGAGRPCQLDGQPICDGKAK
jgi:hypothetical protein